MTGLLTIIAGDRVRLKGPPLRRRSGGSWSGRPLLKGRGLRGLVGGGNGLGHLLTLASMLLALEIAKYRPPRLLRNHELLEIRGMLVTNPDQGRDHVDFGPGLGRNVPRA